MAASTENKLIMPTDMLYLLTFALGMLMFWISGHATALLPIAHISSAQLRTVIGLAITAGVYGLGMFVLALVVLRRKIKPALISTLVSAILGVITAQVIIRLAVGHIHNKQDIGMLNFVLYMCYGSIYILALVIGRKIAKQAYSRHNGINISETTQTP